MEAISLLKKYKDRVDPFLLDYFNKNIKKAENVDKISVETINAIKDFTLSGGKRIRPALVYYAYKALGGEESDRIVSASMAIELIHVYLLIHDDIIDKDATRHGIDTIHERYKKISKLKYPKAESHHFGNSMAIVVGDMACSMGYEIMFNIDFPAETILKALNKLQEIVYITIPGEMIDIILEAKGVATEKEILQMYEGKTARYTFEGPLHLGGMLADASKKDLVNFTDYAIPLGNAFQIRDDVLGVFGSEKKLGKPVGSDIIEGKQTILIAKAFKNANKVQERKLKQLLGNKNLNISDINDFRQIIKDTKSLDYANNLSKEFIKKALKALNKIKIEDVEAKYFLEGIAQFITERQY